MKQGDLRGAAEKFRKALKLDPKHIEAHENLGVLEDDDEEEEEEKEEVEVEEEAEGRG